MKKKFLSLMMATAMVATTSVSAFADTTKVVEGADNETHQTEITIKGNVNDDKDTPPVGTISVTVPTAANFNVDNKGKFTGAEMPIINNSEFEVKVSVDRFIDVNKGEGVNLQGSNVVLEGDGANVERNKVFLSIEGDTAMYLSSTGAATGEHTGIFRDKNLENEIPQNEDKQLMTIQGNGVEKVISLKGNAGKKQNSGIGTAISDTFRLILKIEKSR